MKHTLKNIQQTPKKPYKTPKKGFCCSSVFNVHQDLWIKTMNQQHYHQSVSTTSSLNLKWEAHIFFMKGWISWKEYQICVRVKEHKSLIEYFYQLSLRSKQHMMHKNIQALQSVVQKWHVIDEHLDHMSSSGARLLEDVLLHNKGHLVYDQTEKKPLWPIFYKSLQWVVRYFDVLDDHTI